MKQLTPCGAAFAAAIALTGCSSQAETASYKPSIQSDCEVRAHEFRARHPNASMMESIHAGFSPMLRDSGPPQPRPPYKDPKSGVVFYIESDGRHIAALDDDGRLLWVRNPFVDANHCPYRSFHPYVGEIGPVTEFDAFSAGGDEPRPANDAGINASIVHAYAQDFKTNGWPPPGAKIEPPVPGDRFVRLVFDSSQFGYLSIRTGDFYYSGQN